MRKISMVNLKGGVGKTTTAINMATVLAADYGYRVLIVDNDVQANVTRYFDLHDYDMPSIEDVYRYVDTDAREIIRPCGVEGLSIDVLPANMNLDDALTNLLKDSAREQITPLGRALDQVNDEYDFCLIDNPPGVGINILNAIACANDIVVPVKLDKNALDGMQGLFEIAEDLIPFNPDLETMSCLVTMYKRDMEMADGVLRDSDYDTYSTRVRYSRKVDLWTFEKGTGLISYSPRCAACMDYRAFVKEYIDMLREGGWKGGVRHAKN